jgi:hypothetical protein
MLCKFFKEDSQFINIFNKIIDSKLFIWLCIFAFLVSSLFDCFFFNFGPGLLYSALLLLLEKQDELESA